MIFNYVEIGKTGIEVIDGDRGKNYPHKNELLEQGDCIFLSANNVTSTGFKFDSLVFISSEKDATLRNGKLKKNDIVITTRGTVGNVAIYDDTISYSDIRINSGMLIVRCNDNVDSHYLYHVLRSIAFQRQIKQIQTGTAQPQLPKSYFLKMQICLPALDIQKKISSFLDSLDLKIKCNERINRILEEQAVQLLSHMINEAGECNSSVSEIAEINPTRTLSKGQEARCIEMSQLSPTGCFPDGWDYHAYNGGMKFRNGDTLFARITPCLENGKTAFINFLNNDETAFGSTEYIVLSPKEGIPAELLYCLTRYSPFVDYAVVNMNGSSGRQRVSGDTIGKFALPSFSKEQLLRFGELAFSQFEKIKNNSLENIKLASIRDSIFPKLISGELDVSSIGVQSVK